MKYTLTVLLIIILCVVLLSGCRDNSVIDDNGGLDNTTPQQDHLYVTELTLGTLQMNPPLQKAILQFNNTSTTHYISVIDYSYNTTSDVTEDALLRFTTEITTGKIPDILILTGIPYDRLIALDLLVDLYPYLDSDPELSRDNLMESVLKAHERNEKLFMINQTFSVITITGSPSVLGEYPGWTIDEFIAVLDANPQADIPFGPGNTKHDFLWRLLYLNLYEYVDMDSRTADFNNRDFIELLELINAFPSEVDDFTYDPLYNKALKAEGRQIMDTFTVRLKDLQTQKASFGGEIVFKGWPSADRSGHRFISHDGVAITSNAADKNGAWEFVRTLLMEDQQRDHLFSFPINKNVFNERMLEDMEPFSFLHDGVIINIEPTQEDADEIVALINSTTKITSHGSDVTLGNIIMEGATDLFNGLISAEDAARIIQSRVSIFLAEQG